MNVLILVLMVQNVFCTEDKTKEGQRVSFIVCSGKDDITSMKMEEAIDNTTKQIEISETEIKEIRFPKSDELLKSFYKGTPKFFMVSFTLPYEYLVNSNSVLTFTRLSYRFFFFFPFETNFFKLNLQEIVLDCDKFQSITLDENGNYQTDLKRVYLHYKDEAIQTYTLFALKDANGKSNINQQGRKEEFMNILNLIQHLVCYQTFEEIFKEFSRHFRAFIVKDLKKRAKDNPVLKTNLSRVHKLNMRYEKIYQTIQKNILEIKKIAGVTVSVSHRFSSSMMNSYLELIRMIYELTISEHSLLFISSLEKIKREDLINADAYKKFIEGLKGLSCVYNHLTNYLDKIFFDFGKNTFSKLRSERILCNEELYRNFTSKFDLEMKTKALSRSLEDIKKEESELLKKEKTFKKTYEKHQKVISDLKEQQNISSQDFSEESRTLNFHNTVLKELTAIHQRLNLPSANNILTILIDESKSPDVTENISKFDSESIKLLEEFVENNEDWADEPIHLSFLNLRSENLKLIKKNKYEIGAY